MSAIADAVTGARARTAGDATDPGVPVAATVVLLRGAPSGLEVLMIERPDRGSFAGAWVFPGGKLEPGDRFTSDELEEDVARRAGARETVEETGVVVDPSALTTLSCWDPPPGLALRIRTWFFLAPAADARGGTGTATDPGAADGLGALTLSPGEAVAAEWMRPSDALARHGRGELTLYPPTWVTLHGLADHADTESALAAARLGGIQRFETVARRGGEGPMLLWQGDDEYDDEAGDEASPPPRDGRHRLEIGALPWIYTRSV